MDHMTMQAGSAVLHEAQAIQYDTNDLFDDKELVAQLLPELERRRLAAEKAGWLTEDEVQAHFQRKLQ